MENGYCSFQVMLCFRADNQEGVAIVVYERTGFKLIRNAMKGAGEMV